MSRTKPCTEKPDQMMARKISWVQIEQQKRCQALILALVC
jgi:hypothetical protein